MRSLCTTIPKRNAGRGGRLTIPPTEWERFITLFLDRYRQLDNWHQNGRYYGRLVAVPEVAPLPEPSRSREVK
jgi:hypothetical protein